MRVAVIGAGNWGKNLVANFHALGALAAVAEVSEELRRGVEAKYPGVRLHADYRPLLASDIDAVAIATPPATHFEIAQAFLHWGKDVFVEKPLTLSSREARALVELAQETGRILMVGHLLLYQPAIEWIKDFLDSGGIGSLVSLHQERLNLGRARSVENALWSLGVHDVAVLLHLVGDFPDELQIAGQRAIQPTVEDDVYLHLRFGGGAGRAEIQAHLHTSWLWPEKRRRLTVIGARGMLVYDELDQTVVLHRKGIRDDLSNRDEGSEVVFKGDAEPLRRELEHFLACVKSRQRPRSDGRNGLDVVRVLEQATEQLRRGTIDG